MAEVAGELLFELLLGRGLAREAADAILQDVADGIFSHIGMLAEAEIVAGGKVEHFLAGVFDVGALQRGDRFVGITLFCLLHSVLRKNN